MEWPDIQRHSSVSERSAWYQPETNWACFVTGSRATSK